MDLEGKKQGVMCTASLVSPPLAEVCFNLSL